jgi:hypothetical protein
MCLFYHSLMNIFNLNYTGIRFRSLMVLLVTFICNMILLQAIEFWRQQNTLSAQN